jgi:hypothetical protein
VLACFDIDLALLDLGEELLCVAAYLHCGLGPYVLLNAPPAATKELHRLNEAGVLCIGPFLPRLG